MIQWACSRWSHRPASGPGGNMNSIRAAIYARVSSEQQAAAHTMIDWPVTTATRFCSLTSGVAGVDLIFLNRSLGKSPEDDYCSRCKGSSPGTRVQRSWREPARQEARRTARIAERNRTHRSGIATSVFTTGVERPDLRGFRSRRHCSENSARQGAPAVKLPSGGLAPPRH
jgi:hypothetical protein